MSGHDIEVVGAWYNTGEAGVAVWCETCGVGVVEDYRLTLAQINEAVARHTTTPPPNLSTTEGENA